MPHFNHFIKLILPLIMLCFVTLPARAEFDLQCYIRGGDCPLGGGGGGRSSNPSTGSQVRINPSAVPTQNGFGIEGIYFKSGVDLSLVRGFGRVGAAISPSNSEETFFGPPGFEDSSDYLQRHLDAQKYPNQKYTLAAAASLIDKWGSGLTQLNLNIGAMGKYNKYTGNISPGLGMNGNFGFITFGGSYYSDETQLHGELDKDLRPLPIRYKVTTYNVGIFLSSLILDYSLLSLKQDGYEDTAQVSLITATLMAKGFIVTASRRLEDSSREHYSYSNHDLETLQLKEEFFGGVQYAVTKNFLVGAFYNYYLLHEGSLSATVFF